MMHSKPVHRWEQQPAEVASSIDPLAPLARARPRLVAGGLAVALLVLAAQLSGDGSRTGRAAVPVAHCESRQPYRSTCVLPRAAWNEEILRVREAARRECLDNAVILASDRKAQVSTAQQENFQRLLKEHRALVRSAR